LQQLKKAGADDAAIKKFKAACKQALVDRIIDKESTSPNSKSDLHKVLKKYEIDNQDTVSEHEILLDKKLDCQKAKRDIDKKLLDKNVTLDEVGEIFQVIKFHIKNEEYEIATFRQDNEYIRGKLQSVTPVKSPGKDVDRRDLTINALVYNPFSGNVIDYVGAFKDIAERKLRFVGDPEKRINEHQIRMLRYIRFLLRTGYTEDEKAKQAIIKNAPDINKISPEPIKEEIEKIFKTGQYGEMLLKLKEFGLLKEILPEVDKLDQCEQGPPYHLEGNVFKHTKLLLDNLAKDATPELVWAAILHDIGKPETREEKILENDIKKVSFHKHDEKSAEKAKSILNRLKFSNKEIKKIIWLIASHQKIFQFPKMKQSNAIKLADNEYFQELFELAKADIKASIPNQELAEENEKLVEQITKRYQKIKEFEEKNTNELTRIKKLINGNLIIQKISGKLGRNLKKSEMPMIGKVKNQTLEEITDKNIIDENEALKILDEVIKQLEI